MPLRRSSAFSAGWGGSLKIKAGPPGEKAREMSQISVTIDGRKYRLACNEGEEARLESLAGLIDQKIGEMRKTFGEIGDQRLVIMAALTLADNLTEARDEASTERKRSEDAERRVNAIASSLDALGSRLESVAARLSGEAEA
jgi:cell division protein ZapA